MFYTPQKDCKIFGIGLPKTGNTSLCMFLRQQKLTGVQYPSQNQWANLDRYDFCVDTPCNLHYEKLHDRFPNAKFIYTFRNERDWVYSWGNHIRKINASNFNLWQTQHRNMLMQKYSHLYLHKTEVLDYFRGKPDKLFLLDLDNLNIASLCEFLHLPYKEFPHCNATIQRPTHSC